MAFAPAEVPELSSATEILTALQALQLRRRRQKAAFLAQEEIHQKLRERGKLQLTEEELEMPGFYYFWVFSLEDFFGVRVFSLKIIEDVGFPVKVSRLFFSLVSKVFGFCLILFTCLQLLVLLAVFWSFYKGN